jgi:hypothetical protein
VPLCVSDASFVIYKQVPGHVKGAVKSGAVPSIEATEQIRELKFIRHLVAMIRCGVARDQS